jgi:hypothetical protein
MLGEFIALSLAVFGVLAVLLFLERQGRRAEQNDQMRRVLDDIHAAKMARDSLRDDADAAKRVRDRFTR